MVVWDTLNGLIDCTGCPPVAPLVRLIEIVPDIDADVDSGKAVDLEPVAPLPNAKNDGVSDDTDDEMPVPDAFKLAFFVLVVDIFVVDEDTVKFASPLKDNGVVVEDDSGPNPNPLSDPADFGFRTLLVS